MISTSYSREGLLSNTSVPAGSFSRAFLVIILYAKYARAFHATKNLTNWPTAVLFPADPTADGYLYRFVVISSRPSRLTTTPDKSEISFATIDYL